MTRSIRRAALLACAALAVAGCQLRRGPDREVPLPAGVDPEQIIDADDPVESVTPLRPGDLATEGKLILAARQKRVKDKEEKEKKGATGNLAPPRKKYNILACSGGAIYGAYSAGVLCGWTRSGLTPEQGGRPVFDVVTGISTGSLIAPFAFLGPEYDCVLRTEYTTVTSDDLFERRRSIRGIFAESVVDNTRFRQRLARYVHDPAIIAKIAAAHDAGRRLYIGTTNLDTKRIVLWDIGAIAKRGTPESRQLILDVIVASASIPAFFPAVRINVTIDGRPYEEMHVDGGVTRSLFFRPPHFSADQREAVGPDTLADSNLYVLVAGKIDPAPAAVQPKTLKLALEATSILLYSITRGDLYRMYNYCLLTGMNLRVAVIPDDLEVPSNGTEFDPVPMTKMFNAGFEFGRIGDLTRKERLTDPDGKVVEIDEPRDGTAWRDLPPGLKAGEKQGARSGTNLTVRPKDDASGVRGPEPPKDPVVPTVSVK